MRVPAVCVLRAWGGGGRGREEGEKGERGEGGDQQSPLIFPNLAAHFSVVFAIVAFFSQLPFLSDLLVNV